MRNILVVESDRSCSVSVSQSPLHIIHSSSQVTSCGTKAHPWKLEAPSGQQISVNLLDFKSEERTLEYKQQCIAYGYIIDKSVKHNVSICSLQNNKRMDRVYTSVSNALSIVIGENHTHSNTGNNNDKISERPLFLISFHGMQ